MLLRETQRRVVCVVVVSGVGGVGGVGAGGVVVHHKFRIFSISKGKNLHLGWRDRSFILS